MPAQHLLPVDEGAAGWFSGWFSQKATENLVQPSSNSSDLVDETAPRMLRASPADYRNSMPLWLSFESHIPIEYLRGVAQGFRHAVERQHGRSWNDEMPDTARALSALRRLVDHQPSVANAQTQEHVPDAGKTLIAELFEDLL